MYTTYPVEVASLGMQIVCVERHMCLAVMERLIHWQMIKSKNLSMQSTWITLFSNIYIFSCLISLHSFVNGDRIIESVPTHFSKANGFESITEWLNVIRSGHLKIQATCDIPFQTEVLLDYNLIRYCFHLSGSCSSSTHKELNSNLFSCFIRTSLWHFQFGQVQFLLPGYSQSVFDSRRPCCHRKQWHYLFQLFVFEKEAGIKVWLPTWRVSPPCPKKETKPYKKSKE